MRDQFWEILCSMLPLWQFMLVVDIILLTLLGMSVPFLERGSGSYYISLIALALLLPLLAASSYVIWRCSRRNRTPSPNSSPNETES